jgi:CheY-like chemotaxis protein
MTGRGFFVSEREIVYGKGLAQTPLRTMLSNCKSILIADDDDVLCDLLQLLLQNEGYKVFVTKDGDEAMAAIADKRPDLIILDIMIPGMSGFDMLRNLQAN